MSADAATRREIPDATVARLPEYLRALTDFAERGTKSVSSEELATAAGVRSAQLRKDLSHLGSYGVRGVGLRGRDLAVEISRALGLSQDWPVAIVGMGNLGRALAAYSGFASGGFHVAGAVRRRPDRRRRPASVTSSSARWATCAGSSAVARSPSASSPRRPRRPSRSATRWPPPGSARSSTSPPPC